MDFELPELQIELEKLLIIKTNEIFKKNNPVKQKSCIKKAKQVYEKKIKPFRLLTYGIVFPNDKWEIEMNGTVFKRFTIDEAKCILQNKDDELKITPIFIKTLLEILDDLPKDGETLKGMYNEIEEIVVSEFLEYRKCLINAVFPHAQRLYYLHELSRYIDVVISVIETDIEEEKEHIDKQNKHKNLVAEIESPTIFGGKSRKYKKKTRITRKYKR